MNVSENVFRRYLSDTEAKDMKNKKIIQVPYIDQSVKYPTGCESVSTVMLLQYLGYKVTVDEFIENYLEMKDFEEKEGQIPYDITKEEA